MFYTYKKQIIIVSVLAVLAVIGLSVYSYINSFQYITVVYNPTEGVVKVYDSAGKEEVLTTITPNEKVKVKKGSYTLKWSGEHIASDEQLIQVGDTPVNKTIVFVYSNQYLAELLTKEYPLIVSTINDLSPKILSLYSLSRTKLYDRGEWFGAILTYKGKDSNNRDTLRMMAKKENDEWKVITNPPSPLLSITSYPDVPREMIVDINQPAPLPGTPNSPPLTADGALDSHFD